jgi:hypothetical protein
MPAILFDKLLYRTEYGPQGWQEKVLNDRFFFSGQEGIHAFRSITGAPALRGQAPALRGQAPALRGQAPKGTFRWKMGEKGQWKEMICKETAKIGQYSIQQPAGHQGAI